MRSITTAKFDKQPREQLDYDFVFDDWLASRPGSSPVSFEVFVDPGITVVSSSRSGGTVKVFLSGGEDGGVYNISVLLTADLSGSTLKRELDAQLYVNN